jgi:hypothetical protein
MGDFSIIIIIEKIENRVLSISQSEGASVAAQKDSMCQTMPPNA